MMKVKRNVWTTILLVTIIWTFLGGIPSTFNWYNAILSGGLTKQIALIAFIGTIVNTTLNLFTSIMGIKNDRLFVKLFILARLSTLLFSIIILIYTIILHLNTSVYLYTILISTTYTGICLGYILTSKNIKAVYYGQGFNVTNVKYSKSISNDIE